MSKSTKTLNFIICILLSTTIVLGQDLIAQYDLNGDGQDSGSNSFHANEFGPIASEDRFENPQGALFFDGNDDYLEIENQNELNFGTDDFAISLWIKTSYNQIQMLVHNGSSGSFPQYWLRINDYSSADIDLKFLTSNGVPVSPSVSYANPIIFEDNWHHLVVQRKTYSHEIYFDGELVATYESSEIKNIENEESIFIGAQHPNPPNFPDIFNYFRGSLDDLKFYNGTLSVEQIIDLLNETPTSIVDELVSAQIKIFPNPVTDKLRIEGIDFDNSLVEIADTKGTIIKSFALTTNEVNTSDLPTGVYFLLFHLDDSLITKKIIKH